MGEARKRLLLDRREHTIATLKRERTAILAALGLDPQLHGSVEAIAIIEALRTDTGAYGVSVLAEDDL